MNFKFYIKHEKPFSHRLRPIICQPFYKFTDHQIIILYFDKKQYQLFLLQIVKEQLIYTSYMTIIHVIISRYKKFFKYYLQKKKDRKDTKNKKSLLAIISLAAAQHTLNRAARDLAQIKKGYKT